MSDKNIYQLENQLFDLIQEIAEAREEQLDEDYYHEAMPNILNQLVQNFGAEAF
jgi:hypothetical protein